MKISILHLSITVSLLSELSGQHLDVEGHAKIIGNMAIHNPLDSTSVFIGTNAGNGMTFDISHYYNTFVGSDAGTENGNENNSFFGAQAGMNSTGSANCFFGFESGIPIPLDPGNHFLETIPVLPMGKEMLTPFFDNNASHDSQIDDLSSFCGSGSGYVITGGKQ